MSSLKSNDDYGSQIENILKRFNQINYCVNYCLYAILDFVWADEKNQDNKLNKGHATQQYQLYASRKLQMSQSSTQ